MGTLAVTPGYTITPDTSPSSYKITPDTTPQDEGFFHKAWKAINTPIADLFSGADGATKRAILSAVEQHAGFAPGSLSPENLQAQAHRTDSSPAVQGLRTFLAGSANDTADMAAGFTSPLSLATAAAGAATKLPGLVGKVASAASGAAGVGFAGKGAVDVAQAGNEIAHGDLTSLPNPDATQKLLQGGAMVAGGAAGAREAATTSAGGGMDAAAEALKANAQKQYSQALNPTKDATKFLAQKRVPEMLERGITADSPEALAATAKENASAATQKLNDVYQNLPTNRQSSTQPMMDALDTWKKQFQDTVPNGQGGMKTITIDQNAVNAADALKQTIDQYGGTITPDSMRKVRQILDESVAKAGGYQGKDLAEGSVLDARKEAATAIRQQLAKDNPEIAPLNNEVSFWLDVQKIAKETAQRRVGQQGGLVVPMAKRAGQVVGGMVGYQMGGPAGAVVGTVAGGELAGNMASIVRSTKWRTVSAVAKNSLADALASGNPLKAQAQINFIGRKYGIPLSSATASAESQEPQ